MISRVLLHWQISRLLPMTPALSVRYWWLWIQPCISHGLLHAVSSSLYGLLSTKAHLIFQRSTSSTKSTFLGKSVWYALDYLSTILDVIFGDFQGLDQIPPPTKKKTHTPRCLLLALISLKLNDPRRQGIGIFTSSQMGILQNNSLCFFDVRPHRVYLLQFQILTLFRMLYKLNKAPRRWTSFLSSVNLRITISAYVVTTSRRSMSRFCK